MWCESARPPGVCHTFGRCSQNRHSAGKARTSLSAGSQKSAHPTGWNCCVRRQGPRKPSTHSPVIRGFVNRFQRVLGDRPTMFYYRHNHPCEVLRAVLLHIHIYSPIPRELHHTLHKHIHKHVLASLRNCASILIRRLYGSSGVRLQRRRIDNVQTLSSVGAGVGERRASAQRGCRRRRR